MQHAARILNVDDNDGARYAKTRMLQVAGFDVLEAATGSDALTLVRQEMPDLVLLDVKLPDINGLEVCKRIKSDPATASTLVLQTSAALIHRTDKVRALEGGADNYLVAPIEAEELIANVNALLRLRRTQRELMESEERFRQMAENIEDVFWIFSPQEQKVLYVSPAFKHLWGRPIEFVQNDYLAWMQTVHHHDRQRVADAFKKLIENHSYDEEFRIVLPDGSIRWVKDRGFLVKNTGPGVHRITRITSDISSRKAAEKLRNEADSRKDEFLATLAHELRNPLAPIRNAVELMNAAGGDAAAVHGQAREIIRRQVNHLVHLVDDLLDISRISQGKVTLKMNDVELKSFVGPALETAAPIIESRAHRFVVRLPEEDKWLRGDSVRLAQIVSNLLNNAAKYTPQGGQIILDVSEVANELLISVQDNGIGIAVDSIESIFDLFAQGDVAPDRAQDGLGVGLALVRKLVEMHNGRVTAYSAGAGMGSTFNIYLPLMKEPHQAVPDAQESNAQASQDSKRKILIVDDNADALEMFTLLLQAHGYDTVSASDAESAIAATHAYRPDVIVMDVGLPGASGYEVVATLRKEDTFRNTRIVAVTGYGQSHDRQRALEAGYDRHLVKPVSFSALLEAISTGK
ncbi:response regulator [Oxalobacteraceae bacterium R-40]|uniref:histidine kinase n=1 Tax=Keguizhuia sedimenti TaxID=3064264 RepID=A0ABU1BID7_9BURK|nr:response regulator [Oxalobacteraceae bacterium R-40]